MVNFSTQSGSDFSEALSRCFRRAFLKTASNAGKTIVQALLTTTRNHVSSRYPTSQHWDTKKIVEGSSRSSTVTSEGSIDVNIPGASRAWHDVTIRPVFAKHLAIPMHSAAYGKKPRDFNDLFKVKGKNALFQRHGSGIVALFALADEAHQKKDETLMPSDETFADNIQIRFINELDRNLDAEIQNN